MESNGKNRKSIITDKPTAFQTPPAAVNPRVGWDVNKFETLIQTQGYDAFIDRALRCPCVDKATGQALSTCKNCLGRGWFLLIGMRQGLLLSIWIARNAMRIGVRLIGARLR